MDRSDYHVNAIWKAFPLTTAYYGLDPAAMVIVDSKTAGEVNARIPPNQQASWLNLAFSQVTLDEVYYQVSARLMYELVPPSGSVLSLPPASPAYIQWNWTPPVHTIQFSVQLSDPDGSNKRPWDFPVMHRGATYDMRMGLSYECTIDKP